MRTDFTNQVMATECETVWQAENGSAANRPIATEFDDGSRAEFEHAALAQSRPMGKCNRWSEGIGNGFGRRFRKIERDDTGTIDEDYHFIWDGFELVEKRETGFTTVIQAYHRHGAQIPDGSGVDDYFFTFDHLGSIGEITDDQSALVVRYDYDPYGRITEYDPNGEEVSGTSEVDFRFTGHSYHEKSGLHLAPYRAYDASLGRWLSRDPLDMAELLPEGPNLYAYAGGNPVNAVDPLGLFLSPHSFDNYMDMSAGTGRTPRMGDIYRMPNEHGETPAQQFARRSGERARCAAEEAAKMAGQAAVVAGFAIGGPKGAVAGRALGQGLSRGAARLGSAVHYAGSAGMYASIRGAQMAGQTAQRAYYSYGAYRAGQIGGNLIRGAAGAPTSIGVGTRAGAVGYGIHTYQHREAIFGR